MGISERRSIVIFISKLFVLLYHCIFVLIVLRFTKESRGVAAKLSNGLQQMSAHLFSGSTLQVERVCMELAGAFNDALTRDYRGRGRIFM